MAINTNSKAYQGLLDKGYSASEIQQMANAVNSGKTTQQAFDEIKSQRANTQAPQQSNQQTITYNGQVSGNTSGTSNMNSMSQSSAINNSRNAQVSTGDVVDMPKQPKVQSVTTPQVDRVGKAWEGLDYETQQKKLNSIAGLKEALAKKGITSKTAPTTTQTATQTTTTPKRTTQAQTPKQDQWDYQDNSQARMNQIADNLNGYRQTMPQLFDDMSAFYNFFIKDKGRSQDQIDFLWDYFNRVQKYGKYDNMSPEQLGTGIANGDIPEDYLNTLKSTDPQKYQEVMTAKQNREDTIKNESFLNDAATMAGIEGWESEPSSIKYGKRNGIWMDEDDNGIDDRREHYASEEEQGYQKQIADLNAANLDIDNTVKHDYEDLVEKYPGATKATLMAMANDRNANLLREKENNLVELTRLQGYVGYMQEERKEMNAAGADSIKQLQYNLGMYYDYSPQGIAELAQAKYGATNITLDQADSGNETQKQMALQNVLDGYYDKYGSIIQRSEQQVINDVIAYSKKNGVGLAEALQENFVKPLQQKPQFATLSSGGLSPTVSFEKVGDTGYVFTVNPDGTYSLENVSGAAIGSGVAGGTYNNDTGVMNFTESGMKGLGLKNNNPGNITDANVGEVGRNGKFAVFETPEDGFDALVAKIQNAQNGKSKNYPATATLYEFFAKYAPSSDNNNPKAYAESVAKQLGVSANTQIKDVDTVKFAAAIAKHDSGYNYNTYGMFRGGSGDNNNGYDPLLKDFFQKDPTKLTKDQWAKLKNMGYDERTYLSMRDNYLKNLSKEPDASTVKILDTLGYLMTNYPGREQLMSSIGTKFLPGDYGAKMGDYLSYVDYIKQNLTMDNLVKLKQGGATFGSLTEGERPRIEASATRLSNSMSKDKYLGELLDIYNTYAKNAGMGELTLNDINRMYGSSSSNSSSNSSSGTPTIKPMKGMEISNVQVNDGDIDYDALFASL